MGHKTFTIKYLGEIRINNSTWYRLNSLFHKYGFKIEAQFFDKTVKKKKEFELLPSRFAAQLFQISESYEYLSVSPNGDKPGKRFNTVYDYGSNCSGKTKHLSADEGVSHYLQLL